MWTIVQGAHGDHCFTAQQVDCIPHLIVPPWRGSGTEADLVCEGLPTPHVSLAARHAPPRKLTAGDFRLSESDSSDRQRAPGV